MELLGEVEENLRALSVEARKVKQLSGVKEAAEVSPRLLKSYVRVYPHECHRFRERYPVPTRAVTLFDSRRMYPRTQFIPSARREACSRGMSLGCVHA